MSNFTSSATTICKIALLVVRSICHDFLLALSSSCRFHSTDSEGPEFKNPTASAVAFLPTELGLMPPARQYLSLLFGFPTGLINGSVTGDILQSTQPARGHRHTLQTDSSNSSVMLHSLFRSERHFAMSVMHCTCRPRASVHHCVLMLST